jgi:hypothetical protein
MEGESKGRRDDWRLRHLDEARECGGSSKGNRVE